MTKSELVNALAEKVDISKKKSDEVVAAFTDIVTEALKKGDKVQIVGFGLFEVRTRAAREGVNPRSQEPIHIPECKIPAFKAGRTLKDAVAG